jgi:hypothetical protein
MTVLVVDDNCKDTNNEALLTMDFPRATTPIGAKFLKPTWDTIWDHKTVVQCLELRLIEYCSHNKNIKE